MITPTTARGAGNSRMVRSEAAGYLTKSSQGGWQFMING